MAYQIQFLQGLTDYQAGTTINVGMIQGGTATNVVPADCTIEVDFRVSQKTEADRLMDVVQNLEPHLPGAALEVTGKSD